MPRALSPPAHPRSALRCRPRILLGLLLAAAVSGCGPPPTAAPAPGRPLSRRQGGAFNWRFELAHRQPRHPAPSHQKTKGRQPAPPVPPRSGPAGEVAGRP